MSLEDNKLHEKSPTIATHIEDVHQVIGSDLRMDSDLLYVRIEIPHGGEKWE